MVPCGAARREHRRRDVDGQLHDGVDVVGVGQSHEHLLTQGLLRGAPAVGVRRARRVDDRPDALAERPRDRLLRRDGPLVVRGAVGAGHAGRPRHRRGRGKARVRELATGQARGQPDRPLRRLGCRRDVARAGEGRTRTAERRNRERRRQEEVDGVEELPHPRVEVDVRGASRDVRPEPAPAGVRGEGQLVALRLRRQRREGVDTWGSRRPPRPCRRPAARSRPPRSGSSRPAPRTPRRRPRRTSGAPVRTPSRSSPRTRRASAPCRSGRRSAAQHAWRRGCTASLPAKSGCTSPGARLTVATTSTANTICPSFVAPAGGVCATNAIAHGVGVGRQQDRGAGGEEVRAARVGRDEVRHADRAGLRAQPPQDAVDVVVRPDHGGRALRTVDRRLRPQHGLQRAVRGQQRDRVDVQPRRERLDRRRLAAGPRGRGRQRPGDGAAVAQQPRVHRRPELLDEVLPCEPLDVLARRSARRASRACRPRAPQAPSRRPSRARPARGRRAAGG